MSNSGDGAHILVFPYPAQGHMLPLLDLTHQLLDHGLTITILITPKNLPFLSPLLSKHPSVQTLILPFPNHPSVPPGVENVKDLGNIGNTPIIAALSALHDPIAHWFRSHSSPPVAILSDFFLGWTHQLATELGVPRITFYSSGAFLASVLNHLWANVRALHPLPEFLSLPHLPNSPTFTRAQLPSLFRQYRKSEPAQEFVREGMVANISSWGSVFNSFDALENSYFEHLKKELEHLRVWAVGPMVTMAEVGSTDRGGPSSVSASNVLAWLDGCPDGSVVYVCFGSQVLLTCPQIEALATALEKSGTRFIWVVKKAPSGHAADVFSDGFEDRVAGRGLVIKGWAPQVTILSHRAVGGFLTHCGWNSVLEGIVAGVLLLAWPMEADQFVNAKLLVEDKGVAVRVCEGVDAVPDTDELARTIGESMSGSRFERVRAMELRKEALSAVEKGGSSKRDLEGLVKELSGLQLKRSDSKEEV